MTRKSIALVLGFGLVATLVYKLTRPIPVLPKAVPDTFPEAFVVEGRNKGWL